MSNPNRLANLCNILAQLYPDNTSMRRLIADAGLAGARIILAYDAVSNWRTILIQAENTNRVESLLDVVLLEYGQSRKLRDAVDFYYRSKGQRNPQDSTSSPLTNSDVKTDGGSYVAGDASTGGDFIGRDKNKTIQGDEVKGDKVGRDSYNINAQNVTINQYPEGKPPPDSAKPPDNNEGIGVAANPPIQPNSPDKQIDIFISYSRIDAEVMRRLRTDLRNADFTVWTDDVGLEPGTPSWQRAIEEAIQKARCVIVLLSPEAKQSQWVEIEVSVAMDIGLRVVPLLVRGDDRNAILFRLRTTQRIDVRDNWQAVHEQLIPALYRHLRLSTDEVESKPSLIVEKPKQARYKWQWGMGIAALLVLIVGTTLWSMYRPNSPSTPQSTPTTGQAVAVVDTPTSSALPTNSPTVALTATPVPPTARALPTNTPSATLRPIDIATTVATPTPTPGATWTNPKDGAVYVWINPGEFMMGSSITDTLAYTDERPQHKVVLDGFWMMQTEITNAQYARCVTAGVCEQPDNNRWNDANYAQYPVVHVTWLQAKTYAEWVKGRLPTEAEWEYACRGTDGRIYPWGNQEPSADRLNYRESGKNDTMPVGSYPAGANGLYDMAGNVWEWTSSLYKTYPYNAADGREDPKVDGSRTLRSGSFYLIDYLVRCAARTYFDPLIKDQGAGFRVVSSGP